MIVVEMPTSALGIRAFDDLPLEVVIEEVFPLLPSVMALGFLLYLQAQ